MVARTRYRVEPTCIEPVLPSSVSLRALRQQLLERSDLQGESFCHAFADAADQWLRHLLDNATQGDATGVVLLAVGGYGRGELWPYSDLDVVLVHRRRSDIRSVADAVWYPVWDEGIRLDHSVRRPTEVLAVAADDLRAQLGLLDGRVVAGDASVAGRLLENARGQWRARASHWLPVLATQVEERHQMSGDVAFLLEPDLKDGHGGLRDVHAVGAVVLAAPDVTRHVELGVLEEPRAVLTAARVELQRVTHRATDRLLLQEQDQVAALLGYDDADALMAAIAEAGRTIAWVTDDVWRRRSSWLTARHSRWLGGRGGRRSLHGGEQALGPVEPGVAISASTDGADAEVVVDGAADVANDATLALRVAAVAAERAAPIGRQSLELLAAEAPPPPNPWPEEARAALVRVLATGAPAISVLEDLDHHGLLVRMIPEWSAVRNRPQRNAYHRFTVDRHLLETAAQAAPLASGVGRPDLLLVGALFHDIGKGFPGDHTEVGIEVVGTVATRMGFPPPDAAVLQSLVRNHLLLPTVATRRDLDDPATVATVAEAVGDHAHLELLAALTQADGLATGPAAWGPWKAGLVADLVARVDTSLAGGELPAAALVTDRHRAYMRQAQRLGRSVVAAEAPLVTVVSRDRPGLLSAVAGVFALSGLDVRSADVAGENGFAVETFVVEPSRGRWPDFKLVADELDAVLRGTFPLDERLADQARAYAGGHRASSPHPVKTTVAVDNAASAGSTVVDVHTEDSVGLLHRITAALFALNLDVVAARVSTFGDEVVDAFYVRDAASHGKITDARRLRGIESGVARAIEAR
jgi:[protein-PII] uridylyltransferase